MSSKGALSDYSADTRILSRCSRGFAWNEINDGEYLYFGNDNDANLYADGSGITINGYTIQNVALGTADGNVCRVNFSTGTVTGYSTGVYGHHTTTDDAPAGGNNGAVYGRTTVSYDIQNSYGMHGLAYVNPATPGALAINQMSGVMGQVVINNSGATAAVADSLSAFYASMDQTATSAVTTGTINGMFVYMNGILDDNGGRARGIYIHQGGGGTSYPDYGLYIRMESANTLAGIKIEQLAAAAGYAIDIEDSGGFGYDALIRYDGINTQGYFLTLTAASGAEDSAIPFDTATCGETADRRLRVRCEGDTTDRYIYLFPV